MGRHPHTNKEKMKNYTNFSQKNFIFVIVAIFALIILSASFYTIKSTERGIISNWGKVRTEVVEPGLHFKIPIMQTVRKVNVQTKKEDGQENTYTKDVQTAVVDYTINYDLVAENVAELYKNIGMDYHNKIIVPEIRGGMKDEFGNFEATQIVMNRDSVRFCIEQRLRKALNSKYFTNITFQITEIDYDDAFENAIKEKQVAEQKALKAQNDTRRIKEEAIQTETKANAEANAMKVKANSLANNPKLVEYEAVQKWDGKLPEYMMGNTVPFLNLK